ncbi:reverse transcriptase domain-containing protein [Tanacetum coccineum]
MEAQHRKFLDMICVVLINVPLVDVLAGMPNYEKFLKELVNNKHKIEQIYATFPSNESSAILQNKVPPKLEDPGSFLIPCNFNKAFSCNALANLAAIINLMPYSLYAKLSLETLKPTKMSVRLADQSFQYPVGIAKNMLVEVGKFTFPADFIIFEMEDNRTILEEKLFVKFDEFMAMTADENSKSEFDTEEPPFKKITFNTDYKIKTSLEEPPTDLELKPLPDNLEYIPTDPMDQEKTTFTCPFGTYAYRRMPFVLCNASATFQRCMLVIFHDMIEESIEVFMDDFSVFGSSFNHCLNNLDKMLQRCEDTHLVLNWEKYHFMVKEGIVLVHKVSEVGLEIDKAKIDVIFKLPPPTNIKGIRSFLRHAGFYRRFIKDFSKIACPLTKLLEKDTPLKFNEECHNAFELLK